MIRTLTEFRKNTIGKIFLLKHSTLQNVENGVLISNLRVRGSKFSIEIL